MQIKVAPAPHLCAHRAWPGTAQEAVNGRLAGCPLHWACKAPSFTRPRAPLSPLLPRRGPRLASRSLANRSTVPPERWALPPTKRQVGDCACPAGAAPPRPAARRQRPQTHSGLPARERSPGPPTPESRGLRGIRAPGPLAQSPWPPGGSRRPTKKIGPGPRPPAPAWGQRDLGRTPGHTASGSPVPEARSVRPMVAAAGAQTASLTPPWPRSGSASAARTRAPPSLRAGGGAERAQVTMTKQSRAPAVSQ
jgi:hypothetical protein